MINRRALGPASILTAMIAMTWPTAVQGQQRTDRRGPKRSRRQVRMVHRGLGRVKVSILTQFYGQPGILKLFTDSLRGWPTEAARDLTGMRSISEATNHTTMITMPIAGT